MTDTYTVPELARRIGYVLGDTFPDDLWVIGEISGLNRPRRHVYFDLVEPRDDSAEVPLVVLPVVLFEANKVMVNRVLKRFGVPRMANGVRVRIRAQVSFNERSGRVQLRMIGIDPEYTLGQIALDRERVLRALRADGLLDRNGALGFPPVPLRVGLVTALHSAAYHDFLHELTVSGCAFSVVHVDVRVQGLAAAASVAAAVTQLARLDLDVIAVVRGGGAHADLVAFDDEALARTIARCPVPVLTGVGHEVDRSIADEVAHTAYKTPTACAAALVHAVRSFQQHAEVLWAEIAHAAATTLDRHDADLDVAARASVRAAQGSLRAAATRTDALAGRVAREVTLTAGRAEHRLDRSRERALGATARHVATAGAVLDRAGVTVRTRAPRELTAAARRLDDIAARLRALDPERLLARGWSITTTADGRLLRATAAAEPGAVLTTRLVDGTVTSTLISAAPARADETNHDG